VVEVTGVRGKTSTVHVLSFLLKERYGRVLSLSSSGLHMLDGEDTVLEEKVSIAPGTLLRLSKRYTDMDVGVFEVSLGGTGLGDVSVITGLQDDYPIAGGTRRAFHGKAQMAVSARSCLVVPKAEEGIWSPLAMNCRELMTFGPGGTVESEIAHGGLGEVSVLTVRSGDEKTVVELSPGYLASAYALPFSCALASAKGLGLDPLRLANRLAEFPGAPGRGQVIRDDLGVVVRERNPGVSANSLEYVLGVLVGDHDCGDIGLVLDPVNRKVCEKLDLNRIAEVLDHFPQVTGRYMLPSGQDLARANGFQVIRDVEEVRALHPTVLWATKEGYL
jgi:UDP-N-acetylmuramyl pentapeptide synthase